MTEHQSEIIKSFADCNMNISATAVIMNYHRNSILYHMEKIRKETGLNPRNFHDLVKLLENAR